MFSSTLVLVSALFPLPLVSDSLAACGLPLIQNVKKSTRTSRREALHRDLWSGFELCLWQ